MSARRAGIVLAVLGILLAAGWFATRGTSLPEGTEVELRIPAGSSVRAIATRLDSAGLIDHPRVFALYVRLRGADADLKAGRYRFVAGMGYGDFIAQLRDGAVVTLPLTVPEGLTLREVAPRIAAFTGDSAATVLEVLEDSAWVAGLGLPGPTLEGYLFPDTYRFAEDVGIREIAETMVTAYRAFWGPAERARADSLELSEREIVTLASIVEEEARVDSERAIIAGVYLNRIRRGMLLQADPTVQYALGEPRARLLYRDIDSVADDPYNTYTQPGLPPGPIASPGAASLEATLRPADHGFLFFVARPDGSHEFTRTVREHNNAKNRIRRERELDPP